MVDTPAQTNALQHLLNMIMPQTMNSGTNAQGGTTPTQPGSAMPIMDPSAWMKQGAGNFMPMSGQVPGMGSGSGSSQGKGGILGSQGGHTGKGGGAGMGG